MEFLNRIELRGIVGTSALNRIGDSEVCRFSIVTEYSYKDRENNPVVDTTWFNVTAWEGNKGIPALDFISKGTPVYVCGRLRSQKYQGSDGVEKSFLEIIANTVEPVEEALSTQF